MTGLTDENASGTTCHSRYFAEKKGGAGAGTDAGTGIYAPAVERWARPLGEPQQARVRRRAQRVGGAQPGHEILRLGQRIGLLEEQLKLILKQ